MRARGGLRVNLQQRPSVGSATHVRELRKWAPLFESDAGVAGIFIFATAGTPGRCLASGWLFLTLTDLSIQAGTSSLEFRWISNRRPPMKNACSARWRFNWEIRLDRFGPVAIIYGDAGPVLLTASGSGNEYRSAAGDKLTIDGEQATFARLDGTEDVFDAQGRITRRQTRLGEQFAASYDANNRLSRIHGPYGSFLQFTVDDAGRVTRVRASNGSAVQYEFSAGELARVTSDQNGSVAYRYGTQGLPSEIDHPQFGRLAFRYDGQGRVLSRRWIDGTEETWAHDDQNRAVRHTDPAGATTTYRTSADHRQEETIDASGHKTVVIYNEAGRIQQLAGATGQTVTYAYDGLGRVTRMNAPPVGSIQFGYDGPSRQPRWLAGTAGRTWSFDYDADDNVLGVREGGSQSVAFEYGSGKRINKVRNCNGRDILLAYDDYGCVKRLSRQRGLPPNSSTIWLETWCATEPVGRSYLRTYDQAGRLTGLREPDGATTQYRYASSGLLEEIIDPCGGACYRYRGRTIEVTDPAHRSRRYVYDAAGRLESIIGGTGDCSRFDYDAAGISCDVSIPRAE